MVADPRRVADLEGLDIGWNQFAPATLLKADLWLFSSFVLEVAALPRRPPPFPVPAGLSQYPADIGRVDVVGAGDFSPFCERR